jgi:flagellar hook-basal body complex protein FliE
MIEKTISHANIQSMLETLRSYQAQAGQNPADVPSATSAAGTPKASFGNLISGALDQVNELSTEAKTLRTAYERGEDLPLTDVVLGMQKSSIAFEATLQIRNKVLKAYEDVLNMPV